MEGVLASAAAAFNADNAFVCQIDHHRRAVNYLGLSQRHRDKVPVQRYAKLLDDDPRRAVFDAMAGQAAHCRMGLSRERLHASRTYRDYLAPLGVEYTMVAVLPVHDGLTHDLGFTRGLRGAEFDSNDTALLNELVPHLARGFTIAARLKGNARCRRRLRSRPRRCRENPRSEHCSAYSP